MGTTDFQRLVTSEEGGAESGAVGTREISDDLDWARVVEAWPTAVGSHKGRDPGDGPIDWGCRLTKPLERSRIPSDLRRSKPHDQLFSRARPGIPKSQPRSRTFAESFQRLGDGNDFPKMAKSA